MTQIQENIICARETLGCSFIEEQLMHWYVDAEWKVTPAPDLRLVATTTSPSQPEPCS